MSWLCDAHFRFVYFPMHENVDEEWTISDFNVQSSMPFSFALSYVRLIHTYTWSMVNATSAECRYIRVFISLWFGRSVIVGQVDHFRDIPRSHIDWIQHIRSFALKLISGFFFASGWHVLKIAQSNTDWCNISWSGSLMPHWRLCSFCTEIRVNRMREREESAREMDSESSVLVHVIYFYSVDIEYKWHDSHIIWIDEMVASIDQISFLA